VVVGASGLLVTLVGIGLAASVGPEYDALAASCAPRCPMSAWQGLEARERAGIALSTLGGLALAADAGLWIARSVRLRGLTVAGRF
jgi:hypothetical protein